MTALPALPELPLGWKFEMDEAGSNWDGRHFIFSAYKNNVKMYSEKVQIGTTATPSDIKEAFTAALEFLAYRAFDTEIPDKNEEVIVHYKWALQAQEGGK